MMHVDVRGARIPALGFGTWLLRGAQCREGVRDALAIGYRHIDTAQMYGNEEEVGRGLADSGVPRAEVFLATKLWPDSLTAEAVPTALAGCLGRLGVDYVDLLYIHWPNPDVPVSETLDAMAEEQSRGRVRHLGISNFPVALIDEAMRSHGDRIVANQVEFHPFLGQRLVRAAAHRHGIAIAAYSPLARGRVGDDPVIRAIAERHGATPGQVALRWILDKTSTIALPKAAKPEHRRSNFEAQRLTLTPEETAAIDALARGERLVNPPDPPAWDPE